MFACSQHPTSHPGGLNWNPQVRNASPVVAGHHYHHHHQQQQQQGTQSHASSLGNAQQQPSRIPFANAQRQLTRSPAGGESATATLLIGGVQYFAAADPTSFTFGKNVQHYQFTFTFNFSFHEPEAMDVGSGGVKRAGHGYGDEEEEERRLKRRRRNNGGG
jgi:hypothetical protein